MPVTKEFEKLITKRFNLYNSLFLAHPFSNIENIGTLIPLLYQESKTGLEEGKDPEEIMRQFFEKQDWLQNEEERVKFLISVIRYVERQVVLYDSIEEAAYKELTELSEDISIRDFFRLIDSKRDYDKVEKILSEFSSRIVLTAHPTQFYPPRVLDIIDKLRRLVKNDNIDEIDITLQQLGMTSLLNSKKPTPAEEAKNIIYFLRNVYYDAAGELYSLVRKSLKGENFENHDIIKLGFWPGGDRDGNPFVTSETTASVADELRMTLLKCYYRDVKDLQKKLTFRDVEETLKNLGASLYYAMFDPDKYIAPEEILNPLIGIGDTVSREYNALYIDDVKALIDKVKIFRTHFASLDIRQHHDVHRNAVEAILLKQGVINNSLDELDEKELIDLLLQKEFMVIPEAFEDELVIDTIKTIILIKNIQRKNGEAGSNRYIISNSEDIYSVLYVYALFRWCGWDKEKLTVDIVPLFESMAGMKNSGEIMERLFNYPEYRAHITKRGDKQTIMLGFSDGTKDGGYLQANWSILTTKETLSNVCRYHDIKAIFFDGRGGPPARGGGKTHRFYAAQTPEIASHEIQMTVQGQTISSKFGTKEHFIHNCEQLITANLYHNFFSEENVIPAESRKMIEELASLSYEKYNELKQRPEFMPYLEKRSALKYYGAANIGSRPVKRGKKEKLELEDLRAISYVGSWSQLKQNVPGYFGIGAAIKKLMDDGKLEELKKLYKSVPFFRALVLNSMMSLYKSNFRLTGYMENDTEFGEFWKMLHDEYKLSRDMLLLLSGNKLLMEEEPLSRSSIEIREKIVLPLLIIQQYALQQIGKGSGDKETWEKIVTRSLYGNINASRNSA